MKTWQVIKDIIIILLLLSLIGQVNSLKKESNENFTDLSLSNIASEMSDILEATHDEGFSDIQIDYKDQNLLNRKIFLTTDIDQRQGQIIMEKLAYLDKINPGKDIDLYIESSGGSGGDMLANFIQSLKSSVNTYALDWCSSGAAIVLASGTGRRYGFSTSRISMHLIRGSSTDGHIQFSRARIDSVTNELFWSMHTSVPDSIYNSKTDEFFYLDAEMALEFGIIDEIISSE